MGEGEWVKAGRALRCLACGGIYDLKGAGKHEGRAHQDPDRGDPRRRRAAPRTAGGGGWDDGRNTSETVVVASGQLKPLEVFNKLYENSRKVQKYPHTVVRIATWRHGQRPGQ